jgi:PEP-CTERM motif
MSLSAPTRLVSLALVASAVCVLPAQAATQAVQFNVLNASATLPTPFLGGDSLLLDTLVTGQTGALLQSITFTLGAGVSNLGGQAVWEIDTATGTGPRLIGVNIDIFDAANALVASDSFAGTLGGFAVSTFSGAIGPGTYRMVVTGTAVRDSVLDATLSFTSVVPEPGTYGLMLAGLGLVSLLARRRAA